MPAKDAHWSPEAKAKLSASLKAAFLRPEVRELRRQIQIANWQNPEYRAAGCAPKKEAHKANMGMNTQVECPHCNKVGSKVVMHRWHFDNCKKNAQR